MAACRQQSEDVPGGDVKSQVLAQEEDDSDGVKSSAQNDQLKGHSGDACPQPSRTKRSRAEEKAETDAEELQPLLEKIKSVLGDKVKAVKASARLADSTSCIVSDEGKPSMQMQQILKAMGQTGLPAAQPTLEINPEHEIVKKLQAATDDAMITDASWLLLEQAMLIEGLPVENPSVFVRRLNRVLSRAV